MDFKALAAPFEPNLVSFRVGSTNKKKVERETGDKNALATKGMALAYIDARDVMDRLDAVCSPANWQRSYSHAEQKTICSIGIKIDGEWVYKSDGAGDSDIEAEKGAISDAFKRAAVNWGVGRYLYDVKSVWVEIDKFGQILPAEFERLKKMLPSPNVASALTAAEEARHAANEEKADKTAIKAFDALEPLDEFSRVRWIQDNPKAVEALKWVKANFPEKMGKLTKLGVEV